MKATITSFLVLLALAIFGWLGDPFNCTVSQSHVSLSPLSASQKSNIWLASNALDGYVLRPGQEFSFNCVVGPRTNSRGYQPAGSYLGTARLPTIGGGICLVSSALYQAALSAGLVITERIPHLRTVKTVAPGLDATVWYGQADLKFINNLSVPLKIVASSSPNEFCVELKGQLSTGHHPVQVTRQVTHPSPELLLVKVFRQIGDVNCLISRDLYRLPLSSSGQPPQPARGKQQNPTAAS